MFKKVLVGVDNRKRGRDAIALASQLAAPDAELILGYIGKLGDSIGSAAGLMLDPDLDQPQQRLERSREEASVEAKLVVCAAQSVAEGLHQLARDLAACHGAGLKAMSVVPACTALPEGWLQTVPSGLATDQYQDQLTRFGKEVDLLVVGAQGRGLLSPLTDAGTSDHLSWYLGCPLLVIPGSSWASSTARDLVSSGAAG